MAGPDPDSTTQNCPSCGQPVDVSTAEPLARVDCPRCGEKFRVHHAFDHFQILETLGVGGMGSVYKARDTRLDRLVALKILHRELSLDPVESARLEQEARVTAAVNHPNVVQLFSTGNDHGQLYLVMELVNHGSLDDLVTEQGKLPEAQVLEIGLQIAHGLQAAQEKGLIHRDIKPANILFANERTAKIGDFGLAVTAGQNSESKDEIWGTPYYVAPERLNNEPEDFRSDIFSLGAMLFHALAGVPPIDGESTSATELRRLKSKPPDLRSVNPEISRPTARAINRMIVPDPRLRHHSYAEVISALERAQTSLAGGEGKSRVRVPLMIVGALLALGATAVAISHFRGPATKPVPIVSDVRTTVGPRLEPAIGEARRQLIAGQYAPAAAAFQSLAERAQNQQPASGWIRLQGGLALLLAGDLSAAHKMFAPMVKASPPSGEPQDADLTSFFVQTARAMNTKKPIAASKVANGKGEANFAMLLFAAKDWHLGDLITAANLFEQFRKSDSSGALAWINEYKPLAEKFLTEYRPYADWKGHPADFSSVDGINAALAELRAVMAKVVPSSRVAAVLHEEEAGLTSKLRERQQASDQAKTEVSRQVHEKELPGWSKALADYRALVARYDFAGALRAVTSLSLTDPNLQAAQTAAIKKANWLAEWKTQLISDVRSRPSPRGLADTSGNTYKGIAAADADHLSLSLPYGSTLVPWTKLPPKALLDASGAYALAGDPLVADRQWRCAVFAAETGQTDAARTLGAAAAQLNHGYAELLPLLAPSPSP